MANNRTPRYPVKLDPITGRHHPLAENPMSPARIATVAVLALAPACGGGGSTGPEPVQVASVVVSAATSSTPIGGTIQLAVAVKDSKGLPVAGRTIAWATLNPAVASVSSGGLVTGITEGSVTITATVDGVMGQLSLTVLGAPNLAIARVWLTQGTQRPDGSIALVAGGLPALLNVIGSVQPAFPGALPQVRVRVFEGAQLRFEDQRTMSGTQASAASDGAPLHQVVIPAQWVRADMRVEVVANPGGAVAEARLDDNAWPAAGGSQVIAVRTVAPLEVHLVPIHLTAGNSTGIVTQPSLQEYLYSVRQMFPVGALTATIGTTFSTDVDFAGGAPAAWTAILPQLDALRVIEGTSRYYVGAIRPPAGVTFVQNGGWGYIPFQPSSSGPATRTSLVVGVGWFNRATMTQELVAHELGHNHGRRHAPCGNPSSPDPGYPHSGGTIGVWAHDVYSFSAGLTGGITSLGPSAGFDLMSYCTPPWTSDYTYEALLNVRSSLVAAPPAIPCDCLVVWGSVTPQGVSIEPAFETPGHVALGNGGSHRLEARDGQGRVLFTEWFTPAEVDHAPGVRQFLLSVPRERAGGVPIASLEVFDPAGRRAVAPIGARVAAPVLARRAGAALVDVRWDPAQVPAVLVRDPLTGQVLGMGRSGRLQLRTSRPEVEVTGSLGSSQSAVRLVVP